MTEYVDPADIELERKIEDEQLNKKIDAIIELVYESIMVENLCNGCWDVHEVVIEKEEQFKQNLKEIIKEVI